MNNILEAYNLNLDQLTEFYRKLNAPIHFPDGMVTSLGIIYWGREEHAAALERAIPAFKAERLQKFDELLEAFRTPWRMQIFAQRKGIAEDLLQVLKHDIDLWMPAPVSLESIDQIQKHAAHWDQLDHMGISDQLQLLSACQTPQARASLSRQAGIPVDALDEITRCCDMYRMGKNLNHIRDRIYYDMGFDTWQKWAGATAEDILAAFSDYIRQHALETKRLVPWPKEVRNRIEWARLHLSVYTVTW
jgi:hypothetical protein